MHEHEVKDDHGTKNLKLAFFLNLGFTLLEFIGGYLSNSVSILSDAVHDLGDSLSLGLAWFLQNKSNQKSDSAFSFGYARFSLLGALINSLVLILGSIWIISEAIERFRHPELSHANEMIVFAILGVLVNGFAAWKLSSSKSMNEKVISWHLIEDVLGWTAILMAAIVLKFYETPYLDPALSILITLYILFGVTKRLKETLFLFLQGVPKGIDLKSLENEILGVSKIASMHNTHIWSLDGEKHVFTAHLKLKNISDFQEIIRTKDQVKDIIKQHGFHHYTLETELDHESCDFSSE